ncbi:MAG TPA: phosphotransferase [Aeriscardovia aeriphila]|uniref:Phosphotransferase n=1 Tax=Aeriscardovia aeriphila TaxID=218139 RepID=A0A921FT05_9BIFI|nr:phosphotransferase [Aeriscardovia aeriphila]
MKILPAYYVSALASAAAPKLAITAVTPLERAARSNDAEGIAIATIHDARGEEFDVSAATGDASNATLKERFQAGQAVAKTSQRSKLDFSLELPYVYKEIPLHEQGSEFRAVMIAAHNAGHTSYLTALSNAQATALGWAIARIHQLDANYLLSTDSQAYSGSIVRVQLAQWLRALQSRQLVAPAITHSWQQLLDMEHVWKYAPAVTHGDYESADILFTSSDAVSAILNWEHYQVGDPARDFAWLTDPIIPSSLRDRVLTSYAQAMDARMDGSIMPRARLWRQMGLVSDLLAGLDQADRNRVAAARQALDAEAQALAPEVEALAVHRSSQAASGGQGVSGGQGSAAAHGSSTAPDYQHNVNQDADDSTRSGEIPDHSSVNFSAVFGSASEDDSPSSASQPSARISLDEKGGLERSGSWAPDVTSASSEASADGSSANTSDRTAANVTSSPAQSKESSDNLASYRAVSLGYDQQQVVASVPTPSSPASVSVADAVSQVINRVTGSNTQESLGNDAEPSTVAFDAQAVAQGRAKAQNYPIHIRDNSGVSERPRDHR